MLAAIPKGESAYKLLQAPQHQQLGHVDLRTGETWGILLSGAAVGVIAHLLWSRYYN